MNRHAAVIKAKKYRKLYACQYMGYGCSYIGHYTGNELENNVVWVGVLNIPFLESGESLFIKELNETVVISSILKHSDGSAVYQLSNYYDLVEDEITEESRLKEINRVEEFNKRDQEREERLEEIFNTDYSEAKNEPKKSFFDWLLGS